MQTIIGAVPAASLPESAIAICEVSQHAREFLLNQADLLQNEGRDALALELKAISRQPAITVPTPLRILAELAETAQSMMDLLSRQKDHFKLMQHGDPSYSRIFDRWQACIDSGRVTAIDAANPPGGPQ